MHSAFKHHSDATASLLKNVHHGDTSMNFGDSHSETLKIIDKTQKILEIVTELFCKSETSPDAEPVQA